MATGRPGSCCTGDGVCADFDGCQMVLEAQDGHRTANRAAPEGEVLPGLDRHRQRVRDLYEERRRERAERADWTLGLSTAPGAGLATGLPPRRSDATRATAAQTTQSIQGPPRERFTTPYQKVPGPGDFSLPSGELPGN